MPAKSQDQLRLMEAVKHNAKFAQKVGIPQSVGAEFVGKTKIPYKKLPSTVKPTR